MATLHLLGSGAAISDPHRTTTMLAVESGESVVVVDCGGDVVQRMMASGVELAKIRAVVLTHEHPDHVGGFPLMIEKLWLAGRREALPVYGIPAALTQARAIFEAFDTADWPGLPPIRWHPVAYQENAPVLRDEPWDIIASPGIHPVPVTALRIHDLVGGGVLSYSCDTAYSEAVVRLATGADLLIHEATGQGPGHSTATDAATAAAAAKVEQLILAHLPPSEELGEAEMAAARRIFAHTEKGTEGGRYTF